MAITQHGHSGKGCSHRERLQRPDMKTEGPFRSTIWGTLAFERGLPAITLDVHLQDRGVMHEPVDGCQRHGLELRNDGSSYLA